APVGRQVRRPGGPPGPADPRALRRGLRSAPGLLRLRRAVRFPRLQADSGAGSCGAARSGGLVAAGASPVLMPETATVAAETGRVLLGRRDEQQAIERLLERVRSGRGGVLVVRGEAGVGKTSLLDNLAERAAGCGVVRAGGVQADMELPFAGLQQLFASRLESLERLPDPQREALTVAFGIRSGRPHDRYLVGLAVLGLVVELAETGPLVCVVDDAQWLERASAQAVAFLSARL